MLIRRSAPPANTYPYIRLQQPDASVEHEASNLYASLRQLFYLQSRGSGFEAAVRMMVSGFCRDVVSTSCDGICRPEATSCFRPQTRGSVG